MSPVSIVVLCVALCTPYILASSTVQSHRRGEKIRAQENAPLPLSPTQHGLRKPQHHFKRSHMSFLPLVIEVTPHHKISVLHNKEGTDMRNSLSTHDLSASSKPLIRKVTHPQIAFTLNDSPTRLISPQYITRGSGHLSVAYTSHNAKPFSVVFHGIGAFPVGMTSHPGLFTFNRRKHGAYNKKHDVLTANSESATLRNFSDSDAIPMPSSPTSLLYSGAPDAPATANENGEKNNTEESNDSQQTPDQSSEAADVSSCLAKDAQPRELELAIAFDRSFCSTYGDDGQTALLATLHSVSLASQPFLRQTCIRFRVVYVEGYCKESSVSTFSSLSHGASVHRKERHETPPDPYSEIVYRNDTERLIYDVAIMWQYTRTHITRDVMYLFSAEGADKDAIGRAYIGSACSPWWGVGWVQDANSAVLSHELAHTLDAVHSNNGDIMDVPHSQWDLQAFSWRSLNTMKKFIESPFADCIQKLPSSSASGYNPSILTPWPYYTCETGFSRHAFADCTPWSLIGRGDFGNGTSVLVSSRQADSMLYISVRAEGARIRGYRRRVSLSRLKPARLGEMILWRGKGGNLGSRNVQIVWPFSSIRRKATLKSCCGESLWIQLQLSVCSKQWLEQCVTESFAFKVSLKCVNPCSDVPSWATPFYFWRGNGCPYCW